MTITCSRFIFICALGLSSLAMLSCTHGGYKEKAFPYSADLHLPMTFLEHNGPDAAFLGMNVHAPPVEELRRLVEERRQLKLLGRGEAHVTVVTPPEYEVLKSKLGMERINEIARSMEIQQKSFYPMCLGRASTGAADAEQTFFMVLEAPELLEIRRAVHDAFVMAGGDGTLFPVNDYQPHVTVGFTRRDLFAQDGAVKGKNSCFAGLEEVDHGR
ncbi:MAG: hypothetical protein KF802_01320 [Bdellovibrionaceae bacterium]|nr:hypothetical protein [Pseudobdellovibrionaceae bacterium]MBX3034343.1 hypothetical protein [Pseudobdellovibrionaceae bacterium]